MDVISSVLLVLLHLILQKDGSCHGTWYSITPSVMSLKPVLKNLTQTPDITQCVIYCEEDDSCNHAEYNINTGDCLALKGYADVESATLPNAHTTVIRTATTTDFQLIGKYLCK